MGGSELSLFKPGPSAYIWGHKRANNGAPNLNLVQLKVNSLKILFSRTSEQNLLIFSMEHSWVGLK